MTKTRFCYVPREISVGGRDVIGDSLRQIIDSSTSLMLKGDKSEISGDVAYETGIIQYGVRGEQSPMKAFYITVMKRNPSVKWIIVRQAFV